MKSLMMMLALLAVLTACGGAPAATPAPDTNVTPQAQVTPQATTDSAAQAAGADAVAVVNGEPITRQEYERALERTLRYSTETDQQALAALVLETLIEQRVIMQAATELGITVSDAEVESELEKLAAAAGTAESWQEWLSANLFTEQEIAQATREQLITVRLRDAVIAQFSPQGAAGIRTVTQVRARHILVDTEAQANEILQRLQNGEDFAALAQQFSKDVTTRDAGGDLGFFVREDLTTPELADAAFSINANEIAGPVRTSLGFHVVQTLEFATVDVPAGGSSAETEAQFVEWLREKRAAAVVERFIQ